MVKVCCCVLGMLLSVLSPVGQAEPATRPNGSAASLAGEVGDKGWIVYGARSPKGDWDLFLCRPDGSSVRNITNTPEFSEAAPRFSPDGKKMLFRRLARDARIDHDAWGFQGELIMANADGSGPKALGAPGEHPWASWSPDGRQIACLTKKGIKVIDLHGGQVTRDMPRQGMYQQLFWSPDGKWMCGVTNNLGEMWTVARINAATGEINPVNTFQNCTPDWFADSRRVIFSHRPKGQEGKGWTQLWMADGDGKNRRLIYGQDGLHIYGGATSPDDTYVLFTTCLADGGGSEKDGAPMHLIRLANTPMITGKSERLRQVHPETKSGPVLDLPIGWEPHWTYAEISPSGK
ncbi:MAG: hypothetical protein AMXMBFR13_36920 [Phycisphaerae bacterium]